MILTKNSVEEVVKREAGGKGYNIYLLSKQGFLIPSWSIIGADVFKEYLLKIDSNNKIQSLLDDLMQDHSILRVVSKTIQENLAAQNLSEEEQNVIVSAYKKFLGRPIAVRSSGLDEDSPGSSFAGQFDTYLNLQTENEVLSAVKKCWQSAFSERVISYRLQNKLRLEISSMGIAVILQEMIIGEKSGVTFSSDPLDSVEHKIVMNAVFGLGQGLVSGQLEPDTYNVYDDKIEKLTVAEQVLSETEIQDVSKIAGDIEKYYAYPQDIEWTIKGQKLYILQSRPITTSIAQLPGRLAIWDNSNIVESYSGITLPLTFTFARYVYHQVYVQFCELLHLPQKEIRNMNYFLSNMLGLIHGRVYYNLLNWYRLTSILPGFNFNRQFMETMMGTKDSLESEIADRIQFTPSTFEKYKIKIIKLHTGLTFAYNHFKIKSKTNHFLKYFDSIYSEYRHKNYDHMTIDDLFTSYFDLERLLLRQWKEPIINDFLCMVHFGALKKITQKWFPENEELINNLLCGVGNIESTLPTKELVKLAKLASQNESLKTCILNTASMDAIEVVRQIDENFYKNIEDFRLEYGYRCMNEMKLETVDLYEDSSFIFDCLKNYLRNESISIEELENNENSIRSDSYKYVNSHISGIKKQFYYWLLQKAQDSISRREKLRFCRTKIYGVVRAIFNGIGKQYALREIIEKPRDIFYLELQEILGSYDGTLTVQNLKKIAQIRKEEYEGYKSKRLRSRFMTRGPIYWSNKDIEEIPQLTDNNDEKRVLKGVPCSQGIVEGKIIVVDGNEQEIKLNGEILVTIRTDPGWIPLYPSIAGLLVERGGLLSHSAIVAREMGIPTIVSIEGLTKTLKTGMTIKMNGSTGEITYRE